MSSLFPSTGCIWSFLFAPDHTKVDPAGNGSESDPYETPTGSETDVEVGGREWCVGTSYRDVLWDTRPYSTMDTLDAGRTHGRHSRVLSGS